MTAITARAASDAPPRRRRLMSVNPVVYLVGLVVAAFSLGPVFYSILGGSRRRGSGPTTPAC